MKRYMVLEDGYQYDTPITKKHALKIAKNLSESPWRSSETVEVVKLKLVKKF